MKKVILGFAMIIMIFESSNADSPITSTYFCEAYLDVKIVKYASEKRIIDKKIGKMLMSEKLSIDVKAAIINALSWDINGKNNADIFKEFVSKKYNFTKKNIDIDKLSADELFCLGYLTVMDDYFHPQNGLVYLENALRKKPDSYTIAIIFSLSTSQIYLDTFEWCKVWMICKSTKNNKSYIQDLRKEANTIIFDYISLYESSCE